jgi:hypothetical protein
VITRTERFATTITGSDLHSLTDLENTNVTD